MLTDDLFGDAPQICTVKTPSPAGEGRGEENNITMFEDELPEMTDEEYDAWYAQSYLPDGGGCRIGPVVTK